MNGKLLLLIIMVGLRYSYGQNQPDRYELIIGKYTYETVYRMPMDENTSCPIRINIPKYTVATSNIYPDGTEIITYDTVDHFLLTSILDSLPLDSVSSLLSFPVWLNWNGYEVEVCGVSIVVCRPDALPYSTNFGSGDISKNNELLKYLEECPSGTYIVFCNVCFVPDMIKRERKGIAESIGFKIIGKH